MTGESAHPRWRAAACHRDAGRHELDAVLHLRHHLALAEAFGSGQRVWCRLRCLALQHMRDRASPLNTGCVMAILPIAVMLRGDRRCATPRRAGAVRSNAEIAFPTRSARHNAGRSGAGVVQRVQRFLEIVPLVTVTPVMVEDLPDGDSRRRGQSARDSFLDLHVSGEPDIRSLTSLWRGGRCAAPPSIPTSTILPST